MRIAIGWSILAFVAVALPAGGDIPSDRVALIPLANVDDEALRTVSHAITAGWGLQVVQGTRAALPRAAYHPPRRRYCAERLLDWVSSLRPPTSRYVVGVTARDISTTKGRIRDFGICGLADLGGPAVVISTFRVGRKLDAVPIAARHGAYLRRLADLAIHELGHALGLGHCPTTGCVMEDARGSVLTFDRSTGRPCARCRDRLAGGR